MWLALTVLAVLFVVLYVVLALLLLLLLLFSFLKKPLAHFCSQHRASPQIPRFPTTAVHSMQTGFE